VPERILVIFLCGRWRPKGQTNEHQANEARYTEPF
jgi:hypothetical protein